MKKNPFLVNCNNLATNIHAGQLLLIHPITPPIKPSTLYCTTMDQSQRPSRRNASMQSNISSTSTCTTSSRRSLPSTDGGATPRPNPNRPIDWRYPLSLPLSDYNQTWDEIITECIDIFNINMRCPICHDEPPFVRQTPGQSARHVYSDELHGKVQALIAEMRGLGEHELTQDLLNGFRNRWWVCEDGYLAENIAAACPGLIGAENRDYDV